MVINEMDVRADAEPADEAPAPVPPPRPEEVLALLEHRLEHRLSRRERLRAH
ncbi:hypothetical protein AB0L65_59425 [Nonomuraea sp. NPDC052116]|uniref:hypothetical protein n=1 Tax=Nonomuraea sp. NPDC052116 TaxID=3155665 RepID=UPI00342A432F